MRREREKKVKMRWGLWVGNTISVQKRKTTYDNKKKKEFANTHKEQQKQWKKKKKKRGSKRKYKTQKRSLLVDKLLVKNRFREAAEHRILAWHAHLSLGQTHTTRVKVKRVRELWRVGRKAGVCRVWGKEEALTRCSAKRGENQPYYTVERTHATQKMAVKCTDVNT